jgi:hypothetical protein
MKALLKNWLFLTKKRGNLKQKVLTCFLLFLAFFLKAQIANYVNNGSFELLSDCANPFGVYKSIFWNCIDTTQPMKAGFNYNSCFSNVPVTGVGYQQPKSGSDFIRVNFFCTNPCQPFNSRTYPRNRLKSNLISGKTYCVKYYVNVQDLSPLGSDHQEVLFTDNSIDTIKYVNAPLTFLNPQISNTVVLTDTMNWIPLTGTFTANGTEKFMVLGNFKSDASTSTLVANGSMSGAWAEYFIDYISCIPIDLPAYAGPDLWAIPANTVYLGRPSDVGIDEACMWYKLPNTTNAIDTAAGITITVAATTETYMVKQDICGVIKYDTVVVHASALGMNVAAGGSTSSPTGWDIFPNPASNQITIKSKIPSEKLFVKIYDLEGRVLYDEQLRTHNLIASLDLHLLNGVYLVTVKNSNNESITKKLVITD